MRAIQNLTPEEVGQIRHFISQRGNTALKKRCQCILYSYYGMKVHELTQLFNVDRRSIYNWMDRWEKGGIKALENKPGRGLKPKLSLACQEQVEQVRQAFLLYPNNLYQMLNHVNTFLSRPVSPDTLRRFTKKLQLNPLR